MVKGVGVVNRALSEAFQILKQVLPGRMGDVGGRVIVEGGPVTTCGDGAFPVTQFQEARQGSLCNQVIMLITDGAVEGYEQVFEEYNWPDRKVTVLLDIIGKGSFSCCYGERSPTIVVRCSIVAME